MSNTAPLGAETRDARSKMIERRVSELLNKMTTEEKVGQLIQQNGESQFEFDAIKDDIRAGRIGSVINQHNREMIKEMQAMAINETRLGIPLLIARDVIHGFKTVMPIPLGQSASWNADLIEQGAYMSAKEATSVGINWTFAPMVDVSRDPRWGRIAESFGEDPYLNGVFGSAMVKGFQGSELSDLDRLAACAKHYCGYGASEGGRDYAATNIPPNEMRNAYLKPFKMCIDSGVATIMASFGDIDGVPATANKELLNETLREDLKFSGMVVSDWGAVEELIEHGLAANNKDCAYLASKAGIDMEMSGTAFMGEIPAMVESGEITEQELDYKVANVLRLKFELGLFDNLDKQLEQSVEFASKDALETAYKLAQESLVLLKNDNGLLPLETSATNNLLLIGPLADARYEQLGTWIFDGDENLSVSVKDAFEQKNNININFFKGVSYSRSNDIEEFDAIEGSASESDAIVVVLGEESILSGEAHSRAKLDLPGAQLELLKRVKALGKPVVLVIMAGRPLVLTDILEFADSIIYAWHPGTLGGPAIVDTITGKVAPVGKLPVTMPRIEGQVPIYYNHKNTGRPPSDEDVILMKDIEEFAKQTSLGMTSYYLDAGYKPLFPFGFGLTYGELHLEGVRLSNEAIKPYDTLTVYVSVRNNSDVPVNETLQLYIRDKVASITRPVKELKGFRRIKLDGHSNEEIEFEIKAEDLSFVDNKGRVTTEPGQFDVMVGFDSANLHYGHFTLLG